MRKGPLKIGIFKKCLLFSFFFLQRKSSGIEVNKINHHIIYMCQGFGTHGPQRENR